MARLVAGTLAVFLGLMAAPGALAHIERNSYWPDPRPDTSVRPAAGGAVPKIRSLRSALLRSPPGRTRVVCKGGSLRRALRSVRRARRSGYRLRPTLPLRKLTRRQAKRRETLLRKLSRRCRFRDIQAAVFRSGNNDRIVVMPGKYVEAPSRAQPKNDPRCSSLRAGSNTGPGAATFRYQVACPNDQSLIYVQGRALTSTSPPDPPRADRHGIPDAGPCVRCNVQIEGAGVTPEEVVIDAGRDTSISPRGPTAAAKDVVIRADRADGIVLRNLTPTHAREHGIYLHETDGYALDDFKSLYNGQYGVLLFTSDHGVTSDCEVMGSGDSAVYPGAAPDTGAQTIEPLPRLNQAITRCDLHHNAAAYSGAMGNAVHIFENQIYDNTAGIFITSLFPAGHPGYPQDSALVERNDIYSNNFDSYAPGSDVNPIVPMPIGTGILIIGGNDNTIRDNRIWDNWRRGTMQISLPDVFSGGRIVGSRLIGSTSHRNRYANNRMGLAPDGRRAPNGTDFWWDEAGGERGNCWSANGRVTSDPPRLPSSCDGTSLGLTYVRHFAEIFPCLVLANAGSMDPRSCPWFRKPARPGSPRASAPSPAAGARARTAKARAANAGAEARAKTRTGAEEPTEPIGRSSTPERVQTADCADWRAATTQDRLGVVDRIEQIVAGSLKEGTTMRDSQAYDAIDARCRSSFAAGFLLYELYTRAAAFAPPAR